MSIRANPNNPKALFTLSQNTRVSPLPDLRRAPLKAEPRGGHIPFRIIFFAEPYPLTVMESHSYKNRGGGLQLRSISALYRTRRNCCNSITFKRLRTLACTQGVWVSQHFQPANLQLSTVNFPSTTRHSLPTTTCPPLTTHHSLPTTHSLPLETPNPNGASLSMYAQAARKKGPAAREPR